jgi:hypothetical protein
MNSASRLIFGIALVCVGGFFGLRGYEAVQPSTADQLLSAAERMTGLRAPNEWRSDKSEGYLLLGIATVCLIGGAAVMFGGDTGPTHRAPR